MDLKNNFDYNNEESDRNRAQKVRNNNWKTNKNR